MLRGKRGVSACSLSSCRIRAETLARAFNTRLWPCSWTSNASSAERDDGMRNGIDDDEEFFDASPSPVEVEDEVMFCQQHSSAATEVGRAKLYELLQQHATDDAIDVFYDVSEDAGIAASADNTCLRNDTTDSAQVDNLCESSKTCEFLLESNVTNGEDNEIYHEQQNELKFLNANQSNDALISKEIQDDVKLHQTHAADRDGCILDPSISCGLSSTCNEKNENNELNSNEISENFFNEDKIVLGEKSTSCIYETENSSNTELLNSFSTNNSVDLIPENCEEIMPSNEVSNLPSDVSKTEVKTAHTEDNFEDIKLGCSDNVTDGGSEIIQIANDNDVTIEITETNSLSPTSDKNVSPTSNRLQVFDEPRPKISRTTSLKTGKTPPGTPTRKKIVRFADVLGLDLEDVRHIMVGDIPIIPSSAYTDLNLKGMDFPSCEPISETIEVKSRQSPSWNTLQKATATNVLYPGFVIPGEQPDFLDRVRHQGICLETLVVSDMSIQCTCRVVNYGYHKKVVARYTVNNWLTTNDIDALFVQGSSNDETDKFAFSIFLSPTNRNAKFALKYTVNDKDYWDNNKGQNYCLNYHGNDPTQNVPSYSHTSFGESWEHQFW